VAFAQTGLRGPGLVGWDKPGLIATVFKPAEGALFFDRQIGTVKIDRKEWNV